MFRAHLVPKFSKWTKYITGVYFYMLIAILAFIFSFSFSFNFFWANFVLKSGFLQNDWNWLQIGAGIHCFTLIMILTFFPTFFSFNFLRVNLIPKSAILQIFEIYQRNTFSRALVNGCLVLKVLGTYSCRFIYSGINRQLGAWYSLDTSFFTI